MDPSPYLVEQRAGRVGCFAVEKQTLQIDVPELVNLPVRSLEARIGLILMVTLRFSKPSRLKADNILSASRKSKNNKPGKKNPKIAFYKNSKIFFSYQ